jgi:hypothetical protein
MCANAQNMIYGYSELVVYNPVCSNQSWCAPVSVNLVLIYVRYRTDFDGYCDYPG